jgi:tetratricopeptide (TPR) repeat protein
MTLQPRDADVGSDTQTTGEVHTSSLTRLAILLNTAEGVWAVCVYNDVKIRERVLKELQDRLTPIPVIEISLLDKDKTPNGPDVLAILRALGATPTSAASVISITDLSYDLHSLCKYLELQREALAKFPHSLLLWATEAENKILAEQAPNFYSRLSGIYQFPGPIEEPERSAQSATLRSDALMRRRLPRLVINHEQERRKRIDFLKRRIKTLQGLSDRSPRAIADALYDLAGLYDSQMPRHWLEAEATYLNSSRLYNEVGDHYAEAEATLQAGYCAYRSYNMKAALEHLHEADALFQSLETNSTAIRAAKRGRIDLFLVTAKIYLSIDDYRNALDNYRKAETISISGPEPDVLGEAAAMLGYGLLLSIGDNSDRESSANYYVRAHNLYSTLTIEPNKIPGKPQGTVGSGEDSRQLQHEKNEEMMLASLGQAEAFVGLGNILYFLRRDLPEALKFYQDALPLYQEWGDKSGEALALYYIASVKYDLQNYDEAEEFCNKSLQLYTTIGDELGQAEDFFLVGNIRLLNKEYALAQHNYEQARQRYQRAQDVRGEAVVTLRIGQALDLREDFHGALREYKKGLDLYKAAANDLGQAESYYLIGAHYKSREKYDSAIEAYEEARKMFGAQGARLREADTHYEMGHAEAFRRNYTAALRHFKEALELYVVGRDTLNEAKACADLSRVYLYLANPDRLTADAYLARACDIYLRLREHTRMAYAIANYGLTLLHLDFEAYPYLEYAADLYSQQRFESDADSYRSIAQAEKLPINSYYFDMEQTATQFEPFLIIVASVINGDESHKDIVEYSLKLWEKKGWKLGDAIVALGAGERDPDTLTANCDPHSAVLIRRLLEKVN